MNPIAEHASMFKAEKSEFPTPRNRAEKRAATGRDNRGRPHGPVTRGCFRAKRDAVIPNGMTVSKCPTCGHTLVMQNPRGMFGDCPKCNARLMWNGVIKALQRAARR